MVSSTMFFVLLSLALSEAGRRQCLHCETECPPCDFKLSEMMRESSLRILLARGPSDGICKAGKKWTLYGSDFGLDYNACCCVDVPPDPTVQCDPIGPGVAVCPMAPAMFTRELVGDFYFRVGQILKDTAPEIGCCPPSTVRFLVPPILSDQQKFICMCMVENQRIVEEPCNGVDCS